MYEGPDFFIPSPTLAIIFLTVAILTGILTLVKNQLAINVICSEFNF
jgi:hypothetical protein